MDTRQKNLFHALKTDGLSNKEATAVARAMAVASTLNPASSPRYQITSGKGNRSVFKCVIYTVDYVNVYAATFMAGGNSSSTPRVRDEPYLPKKWWTKPGRIETQEVIDQIFLYKGLSSHVNADDDHFHELLMDWGKHYGWEKLEFVRTNDVDGYDEYFSRFADKDAFNATARKAQKLADSGHLVIAASGATNSGGAAHSFAVLPSQGKFSIDDRHIQGKNSGLDGNGLFLVSKSQAGGGNYGRTTLGGTNPFDGSHLQPHFWVYRPNKDESRGKEAVFI